MRYFQYKMRYIKIATYILIYAQTYKTYRLITVHLMCPVMSKYVYRTRTYNVWNVSSGSFCMFSLNFFIILAFLFFVVNYFFFFDNYLSSTFFYNLFHYNYFSFSYSSNAYPSVIPAI